MANATMQLMGFVLAFVGFVGSIAAIIMVEWKASSYVGDNIITAQAIYEGLWKSCAYQSTGQMQCKVFDSLLQLPAEVVATRGLMVASVFLGCVACVVSAVGMRCTTCLEDMPEQKAKVALTGGVLFIIAGVLGLVGTIYYAHLIIQKFNNPFTPTNNKFEFGAALFVAWGACSLVIIGGCFIGCKCPGGDPPMGKRYPSSAASQPGREYV